MPLAVTHILTPIILLSMLRKKKKNLKKILTPHLLLVAGIAGLLPDLDVILEILAVLFTGAPIGIHRLYTHTFFIPLALAAAGLAWRQRRTILFAVAFGWFIHVLLDAILAGPVPALFPFPGLIGIALLAGQSPKAILYLLSGLDAVVFLLWLWHEERFRKIKDFL